MTNFRFWISDFGRGFLLMLMLMIGSSAYSQSIVLKTGQRVDTQGLRRDRDIVMAKVQVGSGNGEVGYTISQIAKIEFPEPRGLKAANDLLGQRQPDKALAEIEPVIAYYDAFKEVPGSWWAQAALIKVSILTALHRDGDAEKLADKIQQAATDPTAGRAIQVRLSSGLIRRKQFDKALAICDAAIKETTDPAVLADAWLHKGDALAGMQQWDDALLAYLHLPVFYSDQTALLPPALLGAGMSYRRLDDLPRAKKSMNDLVAAYPNSPEAATAQVQLRKMQMP
jgi:tetratricopeptide (TPR) repeat protein